MNLDLALVLALLVAAVVMFALGQPRMDAVALIMLAVLPLTGVITMGEALAGFSDSNVVLIALLFVIGEGLVRTGVAQRLGDWLVARAGSSETRLLVLLMLVVGGLGAVMSSTGVVAIFIPIVLRIAQNTGVAPSRLMMPLSVAALISGMLTLVATAPNLVVDAELRRSGASGLRVLQLHAVRPAGPGARHRLHAVRAPLAVGRGRSRSAPVPGRPRLRDWVEEYGLAGRERRVRVKAGSPLAGRTLEELRLRDKSGAHLLAIERDAAGSRRRSSARRRRRGCGPATCCLIDLFVADANAEELARELGLELLPLSGTYFADRSQEVGMVEVMLPESSGVIGRTLVRLGVPHPLRRHGGRAAPRQPGTQRRHHQRGAAGRRYPARGRLLVRHPQAAELPAGHDRARPAGRAGRGAAGGQPGAAGAGSACCSSWG